MNTDTQALRDALYLLVEKWTNDAHRLCRPDTDGDGPTVGDYGVARGLYACADMLKDALAAPAQPSEGEPR